MLIEKHLSFIPLFEAEPHVFISSAHPLSHCSEVSLEDLSEYPFLAFEQGNFTILFTFQKKF